MQISSQCDKDIQSLEAAAHNFGIQLDSCSICAQVSCHNCKLADDREGNRRYDFCEICKRHYCSQCTTAMVASGTCKDVVCEGCLPHNCCSNPDCSKCFCDFCRSSNAGDEDVNIQSSSECGFCYKRCRVECYENYRVNNGVHWCVTCVTKACDRCQIYQCQTGHNACKNCKHNTKLEP